MEIILTLIILLYAIVFHEVSHGYAAYKLGDPTAKYEGRLTLNPISHLDPFGTILLPLLTFLATGFFFGYAKPVPYNPYNLKNPQRDSILIALAGPLSNIFLAIVFTFFYKFLFLTQPILFQSLKDILVFAVRINLLLAFFNLLPLPPLDGSKLLLLKVPLEIYQYLEIYGFILIFIVIWFFFPYLNFLINFFQNLLLKI